MKIYFTLTSRTNFTDCLVGLNEKSDCYACPLERCRRTSDGVICSCLKPGSKLPQAFKKKMKIIALIKER